MSLPFELRALAAKRSDVLAAMERIFAEEIARVTTRLASIAGARTGSVGFPQRFGSSLNVHVHFHTLAIDGVFEKTAAGNRRRFREDRHGRALPRCAAAFKRATLLRGVRRVRRALRGAHRSG
ncbi:transposase [Sorangium atrum]|uniref:Transposase n=1 Tax=Sorangium atrum TaxID=2995308 RepID=A0ABT5BWF8_9BACT|nr:transposase [Sorangium aterium]MDC0677738.1 transposase [Sorangium aterium]